MRKMTFGKGKHLSRRKFIVGSAAAAGGGLALGLNVPFLGEAQAQNGAAANEVNVWVAIKPDDTCVIRIARSEMGQGTLTGLAQLVAEELECDWSKVRTEGITPRPQPREQARLGRHVDRRQPRHPRLAGLCAARRRGGAHDAAAGRGRPMEGAGRRSSTVSKGVITHAASKRSIRYGKVAAAAAKVTPPDPKSIKLKDPKNWTIAGKRLKRLDTADKLNGSKVYRDRRQAARHAERRDQGLPGVRRQGEELRRSRRSPACPA